AFFSEWLLQGAALTMSDKRGSSGKHEEMELRRGPWTLEEDTLLMHYITCHGEGRWNLLAKCSGLKRTGKSCRLRWLNYLKPDVKRGNLSPEEQLLILELHSKWGNRWSRIAQHLPGRTDNEIKNYWRTRVQKQARQLKVDPNSSMFRDALQCYWTPRLREQIIGSSQTLRSVDANANTTTATDQAHQVLQSCGSYELPEPESRSLSTSSCSVVLSQLPVDLSEFPSGPSDELSGVTFDPFSSVCSMNDFYNLDTWDIAPVSASAPSHSASDHSNNVGDSLWSMDDLYDMSKTYESAAETKVPFADNSQVVKYISPSK
ncbi:unnamed protein product, partial [Musa hybrid cultivar]